MLEDAAQARQNMAREGSGGSDSFLPSRYLARKGTLAALFLGEVTLPPPKDGESTIVLLYDLPQSEHYFGLVLNSRAPNKAVGIVRKTAPNQESCLTQPGSGLDGHSRSKQGLPHPLVPGTGLG